MFSFILLSGITRSLLTASFATKVCGTMLAAYLINDEGSWYSRPLDQRDSSKIENLSASVDYEIGWIEYHQIFLETLFY